MFIGYPGYGWGQGIRSVTWRPGQGNSRPKFGTCPRNRCPACVFLLWTAGLGQGFHGSGALPWQPIHVRAMGNVCCGIVCDVWDGAYEFGVCFVCAGVLYSGSGMRREGLVDGGMIHGISVGNAGSDMRVRHVLEACGRRALNLNAALIRGM